MAYFFFWGGGGGEAELILRIWGAKENCMLRELRIFLSGILGDQCIIFRDQGSTNPLDGLTNAYCNGISTLFYVEISVHSSEKILVEIQILLFLFLGESLYYKSATYASEIHGWIHKNKHI